MKSTTELKKGRNVVMTARRCHECNEEALGRCPDCHRGFCQDHFPKQQHSPCAEKQMQLAQTQVCYVCGTPVYPDQWSLSRTSHIIDHYRCRGCGRHICDELHTQKKTEDVSVIREGLRGHRYQYTKRYCDMCSPLSRFGGIKGLTSWIVVAGTVVGAVFFYLHP
ncbi:MAG TPA: hypothetical protein VF043_32625 [Ktedonobacteraceae bacterium]